MRRQPVGDAAVGFPNRPRSSRSPTSGPHWRSVCGLARAPDLVVGASGSGGDRTLGTGDLATPLPGAKSALGETRLRPKPQRVEPPLLRVATLESLEVAGHREQPVRGLLIGASRGGVARVTASLDHGNPRPGPTEPIGGGLG